MATREWGGVTFGITGDAELRANLEALGLAAGAAAADALEAEARIELADAVRRAPIDTDPRPGRRGGELRESARVSELTLTPAGTEVTLSFDTPYAVAQHQRYYRHTAGTREYLLDALEAARPFAARRIAATIAARLSGIRGSGE